MATALPAGFDFDGRYALPGDLRVVQRDETTLQIGTERPRRMLLVNAPIHATAVLTSLNGAVTAAEAVARVDGDPLIWRTLLGSMLAAGILVPAPPDRPRPPHLAGERLSLIHRHGVLVADRLLAARSDALVVVDGDGPVAEATAALLAASGVGHVHLHEPASAPAGAGDRSRRDRQRVTWQAAPTVRVHRPAPQVAPTAVVLAGPGLPDLGRAAALVTALVPHLAVRVTQARTIVGPLVLPGRSACLNCLERHRVQADPGWPAVARALHAHPAEPAPLAAQVAAEMAAEQVLALIDGLQQPESVGATLERPVGATVPQRRRWRPHPDCGCRLLSGHW